MIVQYSAAALVSENKVLAHPASVDSIPSGGVCSGFMIVQYSAAALVSENKVLAHPASVDSIPSSAGQEDHVSMGTIAARKAGEIAKNVRRVLAMELMVACQGIDMRGQQVRKTMYLWVRLQLEKLERLLRT